jgi:hypothetical protein
MLPTNGYRHLVAISDQDGNVAALVFDGSVWRLAVDAILGGPIVIGAVTISEVIPGTVITTPADTAVGVAATVALPAIPAGTRRMTVQVTDGDATTRIRVRQVAAGAGRGKLLSLLGSTIYGGADGALMALEVENVAGPISAVMVQFEQN